MAVNEVGVFLVERALDAGGDLSIHEDEHAAADAALAYIRNRQPDLSLMADANASDVIDAYNALNADTEVVTVARWPVLPAALAQRDHVIT